jgi:uncharacterized protein YyaL (SSP411 family)
MNQLQNQVSPYLLQHKDNPVHWLPWGDEALDLATRLDKPIILSIGYAACHWCHVMEHESFENQQVADLMNQYFICVKVDREERPDIDLIYMDALHQMGVSGGWPLNVFLMPDQKPFYGGTYFPRSNWLQLLNSIQSAFQNHRHELQQSADGFAANLEDKSIGLYPIELNDLMPIIPDALIKICKYLDPIYGGIQKAPKFPLPSLTLFLESIPEKLGLNLGVYNHSERQLEKMAQGGIFDQVGGGFSRYSVDSEWFCPHFEKMLYDNAQLVYVYSKAFERTSNPIFEEVVKSTIGFLNRELRDVSGLYFASLDADSEGIEGLFYVWNYEELNSILPYEKHAPFYQAFQIKRNGNWEEGKNILFKTNSVLNASYEEELHALAVIRANRIRPQTDTKLILSWNAMAGSGLLQASICLKNQEFLNNAISLAESMNNFWDKKSQNLLHQIAFANQPIYAFLDDYSAYGLFLVQLYNETGKVAYLDLVRKIIDCIFQNHDQLNRFFCFQSNLNPPLISNKYEITDSVMPASNSMLCELLFWSGILLNDATLTLRAKDLLAAILEQGAANPLYHANWLRIYSEWMENPRAMVKYNASQFSKNDLPDFNVIWLPIVQQTHAFMLCIGDRCLSPCEDIDDLLVQLNSI